jgi:hypothetical protein
VEHRPDTKVLELAPRGEARPGPPGEPPDERSGPPDVAPESAATTPTRRVYERAMQLRDMRTRARDVYRTCPADSFSGLSALLEMLLPKVDVLEDRVADAVGLSLADLRRLGVGAVSPFHLPPAAVARLGRAADLTFDELAALSLRDQQRLHGLSEELPHRVRARQSTKAALARLRAEWDDLVAMDEPRDDD